MVNIKRENSLVEEKYNFPKKEIKFDYFLDNIKNKANLSLKKRHILYAPSWNYNKSNLFDDCSIKIIDNLLSESTLTLRPHPEHYVRSKK